MAERLKIKKPLPDLKMYPSKDDPKKWIVEMPYYDDNGNPAVNLMELPVVEKLEIITSWT